MTTTIDAVILAAGKGTRMKSDLPKVLHELAGRPLLDHVMDTSAAAGIDRMVVVVLQEPQLGTGHAVQVAVPALRKGGYCVVLAGDVPLLRTETLKRLVDGTVSSGASAVVLTCVVDDAGAYGRIIKDDQGHVQKIVEAVDASDEELAVGEYNTGVFCFKTEKLVEALGNLKTDNKQGEYYLTDTVAWLVQQGQPVEAVITEDPDEVIGINTVDELAGAADLLARRNG